MRWGWELNPKVSAFELDNQLTDMVKIEEEYYKNVVTAWTFCDIVESIASDVLWKSKKNV